jgi:hypothetical protein
LKTAAAATIDMTKRLGLSKEQMEEVIERTADLSAGKTDLRGGIERVTAALRGEAEASEYLGLTLNETYVKAWHEAHNASGIAWKDLSDLEKAQMRYNVFLEQAGPLAGKAADSVKTMAGAYALAKKNISDAVSENENATKAMKGLAEVVAENADEIGELATIIVTAAAEMIQFVLEYKEAIFIVGLLAAGMGTLSITISSMTTIWRGLNAVMLLTTGSQVIPWLTKTIALIRTFTAVSLTGGAAFAGMFGVVGLAAYDIIAIKDLIARYLELKRIRQEIAEQGAANARAESELAARFREVSAATGVTVTSMKELDAAVKRGELHYDTTVGEWVKGAGEMAAAVKDSAQTQQQVTGAALDEMKNAYEEFGNTVKKINDDIANRERSLAEQLREMSRSGMSDFSAWKDRKAEAEEYAAAAKRAAEESRKAFAAGDTVGGQAKAEEAVQLYDKAKDAAADLNREVRAGDTVIASQQQNLQTAMSMVEEYGRDAIGVQQSLQEAIKQSAQALDAQSGGQLSKELPEIAKQFGELKSQAGDLALQSRMMDRAWKESWAEMVKNGKAAIQDLDGRLITLTRDRHMKIFITNVEEKSTGGLIGYMRGGLIQALATGGRVVRNILAGGFLPGFGGGDTVPLLGERGEVMINKYAVRSAGLRAALAFNAGQWDVVIDELLKRTGRDIHSLVGYHLGGLVGNMPAVQSLATGGAVTAQPGSGDIMNINLNFGKKTVPITTTMAGARDLIAEFRRAEALSS